MLIKILKSNIIEVYRNPKTITKKILVFVKLLVKSIILIFEIPIYIFCLPIIFFALPASLPKSKLTDIFNFIPEFLSQLFRF